MRLSLRLQIVSLLVAAAMAATQGCSDSESGRSDPPAKFDVGSTDSPLHVLDLDGHPFDLWQQQSPIIVVLFVRTDCPISNRLAPEIRRLHEVYHPRGVEFYLVYADPSERPDDIRRHQAEYQFSCRILRDPEHELVAVCQATTTPEAVVFDRDRAIIYRGRVNDLYAAFGKPRVEPTTHDLADAIESTLGGRPVAEPRTKAVGCPIESLVN